MKTINKSRKLNGVHYEVRGPILEKANKMMANGETVIKLNIGNPAPYGFTTPDEVLQDMIINLRDCQGYSESRGLFAARKAIMQYYQLKGFKNVTLDDVFTGNGVSEMIMISMQALLNNDDEVLLPSPDYPLWTASVNLAGGKAVHYTCDEQSDWFPDVEDIRSKINAKTKAIVIINPNNPTGAVYPKEILEQIIAVCREKGIVIFADEIYDHLVMDNVPYTSVATLAEDTFVVTMNGLSKSHRVAGFRAGWMVLSGNKDKVRGYIEGLNMLTSMRLCANVPAQSIIQTALGGYQSVDELLLPGGRIYDQREYVYNRLVNMDGVSVVKPKASFYIFPKLDIKKFNIKRDLQFAQDLLEQQRVLVVHGSGFNWHQPDHFRIVYLPRIEELAVAMDRLELFLSKYKQK